MYPSEFPLVSSIIGLVIMTFGIAFWYTQRKAVLKAYKACTQTKQYYIWNGAAKLEEYEEMTIWFDPAFLKEEFPKLDKEQRKKLMDMLTRKNYEKNDFLYVNGKTTTVLRLPQHASVSFGTDCYNCTNIPGIMLDSPALTRTHVIGHRVLGYQSISIRTIRAS